MADDSEGCALWLLYGVIILVFVVFMFAFSAAFLIPAAMWGIGFPYFRAEHRRAKEERERQAARKRIAPRADWYRDLLSNKAMVGLYKGGHPELIRETSVILEVTANGLRITPKKFTKNSERNAFPRISPESQRFQEFWDRDLSVVIDSDQIEFVGKDLKKHTANIQRDPLGRAIVGGLVAGGAGAVVGGLSGLQDKTISSYDDLLLISYHMPDGAQDGPVIIEMVRSGMTTHEKTCLGWQDPDVVCCDKGFKPFIDLLIKAWEEHKKGQ